MFKSFGIAANAPVLSGVSGSATGTVTATLSNFTAQLRVGDVVAFSNNGASHRVRVTAVTSNTVFTVARITSNNLTNGSIDGAMTLIRPEIKFAQKRSLLTPIAKAAVKSTSTNSQGSSVIPLGYFRKSYVIPSSEISSGAFSLSAGSNLVFRVSSRC